MEPKRLYKIEEGKKVSGVCGGFAEYFNIDPSFVRIGWALFACFAGIGFVAYIIAAVVLPYKSDVVK